LSTTPQARRIIRTYMTVTALFNAALALIWGVNTLFLIGAGLDIFRVMLVNAAFSFGQFVFEIPTGVIADTIGRRASLRLCLVTVLVATLAYLGIAWAHLGFWWFVAVSVLLGLGFTFYTGAVDAWLVDELRHAGHTDALDPVFARSQAVFGVAMLVGTIGGGFLGQLHLYVPYAVRAVLIVPALVLAWTAMPENGFTPRTLRVREVPGEMKRVFVLGVKFGLGHRIVRPLMLYSLVGATFEMFGFYSWQRYFLDLLHRDLVWVTGVIAALVALAGIAGNLLLKPLTKLIRRRTSMLAVSVALQGVAIILCGRLGSFYPVVGLYLVWALAAGLAGPVKQGLLNAHIPSEQRATILSLDALFADLGSGVGQSGFGYLARVRTIADSWVAAGATLFLRLPLLLLARRCTIENDLFDPSVPREPATAPDPRCPGTSKPRLAGEPAAPGTSD